MHMAVSKKTYLKIGLMVPINNTTMERELPAWLPAGSTCTTARIPRGKGLLTPEAMPAYKAQALALAAAFADPDIDIVVYGCTAAGFIAGPAGEAELAAELAQVTGKPVVTTALSMVATLQETGARDIALVTPPLYGMAAEPIGSTQEHFSAFLKAETAMWAKVIKDGNITAE